MSYRFEFPEGKELIAREPTSVEVYNMNERRFRFVLNKGEMDIDDRRAAAFVELGKKIVTNAIGFDIDENTELTPEFKESMSAEFGTECESWVDYIDPEFLHTVGLNFEKEPLKATITKN